MPTAAKSKPRTAAKPTVTDTVRRESKGHNDNKNQKTVHNRGTEDSSKHKTKAGDKRGTNRF